MTQFSFNLVDEPWLPCLQEDGSSAVLSIRNLLAQSHLLKAMGGDSPLETAALHRFLLAILHRVFGPKDEDVWAELWMAKQWDMEQLDTYLKQWYQRFDLFDATHPFYQSSDPRVKSKSTISLSHDRASGNNPTLFDHHTEMQGESLTPAQAARILITAQAFGLAGLSGIPQNNFTDGTCASGIIFLVEGNTLYQTLLLNMIGYPPHNDFFSVHSKEDRPAWEMVDPFTPDRAFPFGYLDYLTWQNRRIYFQPESDGNEVVIRMMTMGPALRYESTLLDPMKHYRHNEKLGFLNLSFTEDRMLWRDSASLLTLASDSGTQTRASATLRWVKELVDATLVERHKQYRNLALGMSKKQAKVYFFREERLPLPLAYLSDQTLVVDLSHALTIAEDVARQLWGAARTFATHLLSPQAEQENSRQPVREDLDQIMEPWGVERHYWSTLEIPFYQMLVSLPQPQEKEIAMAAWREIVRKAAWDSFEHVVRAAAASPRAAKAEVRARGQLASGLVKIFPASAN